MLKKDLSITFMGVKFPNPFCLSSSPVGNCYDMCAKAYETGWGGVVFKTIGPKHYLIDEVSPRFDALTKEAETFVGFKNMEQIAEHSLEENLADLRRLKKNYLFVRNKQFLRFFLIITDYSATHTHYIENTLRDRCFDSS